MRMSFLIDSHRETGVKLTSCEEVEIPERLEMRIVSTCSLEPLFGEAAANQ